MSLGFRLSGLRKGNASNGPEQALLSGGPCVGSFQRALPQQTVKSSSGVEQVRPQ